MKLTDFSVSAQPGKPFTLLQLTDMQVIDAAQQRRPDRLKPREIEWWQTGLVSVNCYDRIAATVREAKPDLIFITGDIVYGEFDDAGTSLSGFIAFMESLGIPWAPVFGNHDNESKIGITEQCRRFSEAPHCLFARGSVSGNSNYTVGIYDGETLSRVLYMTDSNGCGHTDDPDVCRRIGLAPDQTAWLADTAAKIEAACGHTVPGFFCCHIPTPDFHDAVVGAGYQTEEEMKGLGDFCVGSPVPSCDNVIPARDPGDSGCKNEVLHQHGDPRLAPLWHAHGIDGAFAGHFHRINLSVLYDGIRYTLGVKCGTYDYHAEGQTGGTKITLSPDRGTFTVTPIYNK